MEDSSREQSPDWLRAFQAPSRPLLSLSSDSDPSPSNSPLRVEDEPEESVPQMGQKTDTIFIDTEEDGPAKKSNKPKMPKKEKTPKDHDLKEENLDACEGEAIQEDSSKKPILHDVSSRLPLVLPEKVQRSKALVECEGDSIDLSGDVGAVGRVVISQTASGDDEMLLDLKGTIYKSTIVPSTTFCVVSFGPTEAKIESIMTDYVQLKPHSNVFEAETMIEGTLDGFSFDSEDEGDRLPKNAACEKNEENEDMDQANGKAEKSMGAPARKKAKTAKPAAGKPTKRGAKKPPNAKKGKGSKK